MKPRYAMPLTLAAGVVLISVSSAVGAPAALNNKTILVGFTISGMAKTPDGGTTSVSRNVQRTVYVSTQGRVFVRAARQAGRNSETKERGPGEGGLRFAGNNLVGVMGLISGASQLVVSFDPGFQSCTTNVIMGAENGKPITWKGLNGKQMTAVGRPTVSGQTCSIRDGNALAD